MKLLSKVYTTCLLVLLFGGVSIAQGNFFKKEKTTATKEKPVEALKNINKYSLFSLDEASLMKYMHAAPKQSANKSKGLLLEIPLPNGQVETFLMKETATLSPEVAAQYPDFKSYVGQGVNDQLATLSMTITPYGFGAVIHSIGGEDVYFEKYTKERSNLYFAYYTKDAVVPQGNHKFKCGVDALTPYTPSKQKGQSSTNKNMSGPTLRTIRLAMTGNVEFTTQNGGTQASGLAAIMTIVTNMNVVFNRELAVTFSLVNGTNLVYAAEPDPFDQAGDFGTMIDDNHANSVAVLGVGNFDIGHILGYDASFGSGSGLAALGALCNDSFKGSGGSIIGDGYGQVFTDQLIYHEIGHQFGMTHSYNSVIPVCTTRNQPTSVEPGAGATIMSYGFTCDGDDYFTSTTMGPFLNFHTVNYEQAEIHLAGAGNCWSPGTASGNAAPVITSVPATTTVPISTPFSLTGVATDDGGTGPLTYSWEGTNVGSVANPDAATLEDPAQGPYFRSYPPSTSPTRYYPLLSAILDGSNDAVGDKLPSTMVVTTHRFTVRDNNATAGGVTYADATVNVGPAGPFLVTSNLTGLQPGNSTPTITWSVNSTNTATYATNVDILLTTDGCQTFTVLLANTPNDGSQMVTIPNDITTSTARIKVRAVGNIFFDVSNTDFSIAPAAGPEPDPIPTMGEWGLIILGLILLTFGIVSIRQNAEKTIIE